MFKIDLKISNAPIFTTEKAKKIIEEEQRRFLTLALVEAQNRVKLKTPVGVSGILRESIGFKIVKGLTKMMGILFAGTQYALVMEDGRRKGTQPPSAAIERWISKSSGGRGVMSGLKSKFPKINLRQAAFVVARSIKRKGIKGKKFFSKGVNESKPRIKNLSEEFKLRVATRLMDS